MKNFGFLEKFQIFGKVSDFRKNFRFFGKNQIFGKISDFQKNFWFSEKFRFLEHFLIFGNFLDFWRENNLEMLWQSILGKDATDIRVIKSIAIGAL